MRYYNYLGIICLLIGFLFSVPPTFLGEFDILQVICFLLGMICFGIFSGLSLYVGQQSASEQKPIGSKGAGKGVDRG
ncbi:hypothetical protein JE959_001723 [Aeromonas veronii]|nr:hypothetical protein [Aeromonas veronii]